MSSHDEYALSIDLLTKLAEPLAEASLAGERAAQPEVPQASHGVDCVDDILEVGDSCPQ
jgi:hypothetical protein